MQDVFQHQNILSTVKVSIPPHTRLRTKEIENTGRHRIAILIPYLSQNYDGLPPYTPFFLRTAQGSSSLVDFLIFHNGEINSYLNEGMTSMQNIPIPSNVKFIDLKSTRALAQLLSRVVDERLVGKSRQERDEFVDKLEKYIHSYPYSLVEFKPAMGYIFEKYLKGIYTHWGYADIDIVFGDLPRWITSSELETYDIVSYGYGDQDRVYLRGQFTFHKNSATVNNIWRRCAYLSELDYRFENHSDKRLHFESAEGCYSHAVLETKDIKVKYAVKAFTDHLDYVNTRNTAIDHGLFVSHGSKESNKIVIYKAGGADKDGENILNLSTLWFEGNDHYGLYYKNISQPLQWEVGERTRVESYRSANIDKKCMYWAPSSYQPDICVKNVTKWDTVFLIDGVIYKQRFEQFPFPGNIESFPIYHFQEWKRSYRSAQLLSLQYDPISWAEKIGGWVVLQEGVVPLLDQRAIRGSSSTDVDYWLRKNKYKKYHLPSLSFCLRPEQGRQSSVQCKSRITWTNDVTLINSNEDLWLNVDMKTDVTLAMTAHFSVEQVQNRESARRMFDIIKSNMMRWGDNPIVLLIYVNGFEKWIQDEMFERFRYHNDEYKPYLIGAIFGKDATATVSRKALINMAEVACPTRWVISGLELERGLVLSEETHFFANRVPHIYGASSESVFVIPSFGSVEKEISSIVDLWTMNNQDSSKITSDLHALDCLRCETADENSHDDVENKMDQIWWELTRYDFFPSKTKDDSLMKIIAKLARAIQLELSGMLQQGLHENIRDFDKSMILLIDMAATPRNFREMTTLELVTEVDEFIGARCMNALRLAQLSTLGYKVLALSGAFAISSPESRRGVCSKSYMESRCEGCLILEKKTISSMARAEAVRSAKAALFTQGIKESL